jgi:hypothetical protein
MRWVQNVACMGLNRNVYRVLVGKHDGKYYLDDRGIHGRTILKWISKK